MDVKHFPEFYKKNIKRVYQYLYYRIGGSKERAEDLTHDVFLKAFKAFESFDPAISQSSWLYTIARNHLINQVQKDRPSVDLDEIENTIWDKADWPEKLALRYDERRLWTAMQALEHEDREIVRLKHLEGWSFDEIAEKLKKTPGALRVQSSRALKKLRTILKQK